MRRFFSSIWSALGTLQALLQALILLILPQNKGTSQGKIRVFNWRLLVAFTKPWHVVCAIICLAIVIPLAIFLIQYPVLDISIIGSFTNGVQFIATRVFGIQSDIRSSVTFLLIIFFVVMGNGVQTIFSLGPRGFIKNLPWFAMREELMFRSGAQNWTFIEKLASCISFGLIHFTMLFVPVGACVALSVAGMLFMAVYMVSYQRNREELTAVLNAAIVHALYNAILLGSLLTLLILNILLF